MSQDNKNKPSRSGAAPSFKIPTAAKLACMGLLSGTAVAPTVATAGVAFIPVPVAVEAVDDHYVTPVDTALSVLASTGSTKTLAQNDKVTRTAPGNATSTMKISALETCPSNTQPQLIISLFTPPEHGNVSFSHTICDGTGTTPNNFGSFVYTPEAGYTGTDSFVYSLRIGSGEPSNATASILVGEQFGIGGGALDAALLAPFALAAGAGWARRRKKTNSEK